MIDAINADKPYDQFLREQIAGDILAARTPGRRPARSVRRAGDGHRLPRRRPPVRLRQLQGPLPDDRRHHRHPRQGHPRPDDRLRPMPRPQVRPDQRRRLLRPLRDLREHPLSLPPAARKTGSRATTSPLLSPPSSDDGSRRSEAAVAEAEKALAAAEERRRRDRGRGRRRPWPRATSPTAASRTSRHEGVGRRRGGPQGRDDPPDRLAEVGPRGRLDPGRTEDRGTRRRSGLGRRRDACPTSTRAFRHDARPGQRGRLARLGRGLDPEAPDRRSSRTPKGPRACSSWRGAGVHALPVRQHQRPGRRVPDGQAARAVARAPSRAREGRSSSPGRARSTGRSRSPAGSRTSTRRAATASAGRSRSGPGLGQALAGTAEA